MIVKRLPLYVEISIACLALFGGTVVYEPAVAQTKFQETKLGQSAGEASAGEQFEEIASVWGLTSQEYVRYQELMTGPRGYVSIERITPIEVLGIEARTNFEREKYARLYAKMMLNEAEKGLAFTRAVTEAYGNILGDTPSVNHARINELRRAHNKTRYPDLPLQKVLNRRLMVFIPINCSSCSKGAPIALSALSKKKIYRHRFLLHRYQWNRKQPHPGMG